MEGQGESEGGAGAVRVTSDPTAFFGWVKVGRRKWEIVCSGVDYDTCFTLLLAHELPKNAISAERQVCKKGQTPGRRNWLGKR